MHVPGDVAERARKAAEEHDVDVLVSVGGGSATGLAKAVALTTGLPVVAVPTTYAGGGHERLGAHRGRPQDHRGRLARAAAGRRLRRQPHAVAACAADRSHRPQCPGALRRLVVGATQRPG